MQMKTGNTDRICPYTGLRSFTEEESLYFKGRDGQVDQIVALLEQNKFLMVTGASGEGKSSLVYGGLIPNARAGFFKAQYTNWIVADFRPERTPVANMAKALADKFGQQSSTIETELKRGFSSLVDLYTNSDHYTDEQDERWKNFSDVERKEKKRKAANLLIIVDQFEEFFTNPENFHNETLSQDSQVVVNLILETARIALKRNLPIYLVCTMRSDYIGQCSAFRGLPEYIGFSQFFVPRLKRKDLKQVIEEPAILSGNQISQRLIERLLFDLSDGVDQLPILQHALNQIWLAASHGEEEMDLIHYAMVGGMTADELPDEDQKKFETWLQALPESKRQYFTSTGLNKAIEIHANTLYESASEYHNKQFPNNPISKEDAKLIVATTFACLTKIDNSRAVRNRMTLKEITEIINLPNITDQNVAAVIGSYREEQNAFIRPFKSEGNTALVSSDTVLDITHESLIRNWGKLNEWATTEFEHYTAYLDFKTQLTRWKQSGKSGDYLLPIGPLTYFESWFVNTKPNAGWIKRYAEVQQNSTDSQREAESTLADIREFLKKSARKVAISRTFMKYGTQRIAAVLAVVIMLTLSSFYWYDAALKQNDRVVEAVREEAVTFLASQEVNSYAKAEYLLIEERYEPGYLIKYLKQASLKDQLDLSICIYQRVQEMDFHFNLPVKHDLIALMQERFSLPEFENDPEFALTTRNKLVTLLIKDEYYNPNEKTKAFAGELARANNELVKKFFKQPELYKPNVPTELNLAIQYWLTFGNPSGADIDSVLILLSPITNTDQAKEALATYYPQSSTEPNGRIDNNFNGVYHTLASLHSAKGDVQATITCFEALLSNQREYFEFSGVFNNHVTIIGYLYQFGHRNKVQDILRWISTNTVDNAPITLLRNAVKRSGYISWVYGYNIFKNSRSYSGNFNVNLSFLDRNIAKILTEDYQQLILKEKNPNEQNFLLAISAKRTAMFMYKYRFDRNLPQDQRVLDSLFDKAVFYYQKIDPAYAETMASINIPYYLDGVRPRQMSRKNLFLYPDYMDGWFTRPFQGEAYFNYLVRNKLLDKLYRTQSDLEMLHLWVAKSSEVNPPNGRLGELFPAKLDYLNYPVLSDTVLIAILNFVEQHPEGSGFDKNLPRLILINQLFEKGDTTQAFTHFRKFDIKNSQRSMNRYEYLEKMYYQNQLEDLSVNLALSDHHPEAVEIAELFNADFEKIFSYIGMARNVYKRDTSAMTFVYLDSAFSLYNRIDYNNAMVDSRFNLLFLLAEIGGRDMNARANEMMRNFGIDVKRDGALLMGWGSAVEGNYYKAKTYISSSFTEREELAGRQAILLEACKRKESNLSESPWRAMDEYYQSSLEYIAYVSQ
jgi:energy-coupling factor transporter ATP-binding protein EcfA2